ncbi:MAG: hypothetical protein KAV87_20780 [Desulfobacteraceae bacterium]|nr:hypothetical protein [Desulfobacteraceae bacterium]
MAEVVITVKGKNESKEAFSSVKDSATSAFDKVKSAGKSAFADLKSIVSDFKEHWIGVTAAIGAVWLAASKGWDLAEQSAQFEQSQQAFRSMVEGMGRDAETEFAKIRVASAGLIDEKSLVESANKAMSLGIPVEELGDLMEIARAKARDMGITTTQAFDDIATGIGRGSPLILDNLGLVVKLGPAYEVYADSVNKTVEQLSDQEKKTAILNATIEAGSEALERHDLALLTNLERMQKMTAIFTNMKLEVSALLTKGLMVLWGTLNLISAAAEQVASSFYRVLSGWGGLTDAVRLSSGAYEHWKQKADEAASASKGLWQESKDSFGSLLLSAEEIAQATETITKSATGGSGGKSDTAKKSLEKHRNYLKTILKEEITVWQGYYSTLEKEHKEAAQERLKWEGLEKETKQEGADIFKSISETFNPAPALDEFQQFWSKVDALDASATAAMQMEGEAKVNAFREIRLQLAELPKEVKDGSDEIVSSLEVFNLVSIRYEDWSKAIQETVVQEKEAAASREEILKTAMEEAEKEVNKLKELMKNLTMDVDNSHAKMAIKEVESMLVAIPDTTTKTIYLETINSEGGAVSSSAGSSVVDSEDPSAPFGTYSLAGEPKAIGTSYVPKTGLYQLHQGEEVSTRNEVTNNNKKAQINLGGINISLTGGGDKSPEQQAKELAKHIDKELKKLRATYA